MKSIFLCENAMWPEKVYAEKSVNFLKTEAGLDGCVYTKEKLAENPDTFKDVEYVFSTWGMPTLTEEEIKAYLPSLKCVFYAAGTVQYFARPFIKSGIKVYSAWAANGIPVAEYTVSQIILANKGFFATSRLMSRGAYVDAREESKKYSGNFGGTVGIIGAGMIGKLVIRMLKNYNLQCLVFDPFLSDADAEKLGVRKCSLEELFASCTVVSNHLANNEQTKGMLGESLFRSMLPYATFINTGRGAQVVEEGLIRVLTERPDMTAVLDVTYPEPPLEDSAFFTLENCILTPHIAGSIGDEVCRMAEFMVEEYKRFVSGEKCLYEVSEAMLETMA